MGVMVTKNVTFSRQNWLDMDTEFRNAADRQNADQSCQNIDTVFEKLMKSVCSLKQDIGALQRLKNQLLVHAQQTDIDLQSLHDYHKQLRMQLERCTEPAPVPVAADRPFDTYKKHEPVRDGELAKTTDIAWDVDSMSGAFNKQNVKLRYALNMGSVLCTVRFSHDGSMFAFTDGTSAFIVRSADGTCIGKVKIPASTNQKAKEPEHLRAVVFSPDSRYLALTGHNNTIVIIDVAQCEVVRILEGHTKDVSSLVFLSNSQTLISGGFDSLICVWDLSKPENTPVKKIPHMKENGQKEEMILKLSIAPEDEFIAVGFMNGNVGIYEPTFQQPVLKFSAHNTHLLSVTVSPSRLIGTTSHDSTAKVWLLRGLASCKTVLTGHTNFVLTIAFAPSEPIAFTGSKDETIKCWNFETGENLFTITGHKNTVLQIDHHPSSKTIVSCGGEGLVCVWDYNF